jgi:APA family basic amino acid/polyamine antiporter
MSQAESSGNKLKPTLGLVGVTINAMALIAPGAFLWTTFAVQSPSSSALNMWASVAIATIIALLTASCFATLAKAYPQAGAGSSYFYSEAAVISKEEHKHYKFARILKFFTGWSAILYYWVYPGVMVAFMGTLIQYIGQMFNPNFAKDSFTLIAICVVFAILIGGIAFVGVSGSTFVNIIINVIQITSLVIVSLLFILYRFGHPEGSLPNLNYAHKSALSVFLPHDLSGLVFQTTIAILLVVGFESATAFAAEAKNPGRDIPKAVILSLAIQACICYFFEYFAANFYINDTYRGIVNKAGDASSFNVIDSKITDFAAAIKAAGVKPSDYVGGKIVTGFDAANLSGAPIGDMMKIVGDTIHNGFGFWIVFALAITVFLALVGTTLSSLSTGARISYAMGDDRELPPFLAAIHETFSTPYLSVIVLVIVSAIVGAYGVLDVNKLTQVTLISNIGTFMFYGITCFVTLIARLEHLLDSEAESHPIRTIVIPLLGAVLNLLMMIGVFYFGFSSGGDSAKNAQIAIIASIAFFVAGFAYFIGTSLSRGRSVLLPPNPNHPLRDNATETRR